VSQRLSVLRCRKTLRGKPGSERYSGNPTVADRRGACGNVDHGGMRNPPRLSKERVMVTLGLKSRAPQFYPDPSAPGSCTRPSPEGSTRSMNRCFARARMGFGLVVAPSRRCGMWPAPTAAGCPGAGQVIWNGASTVGRRRCSGPVGARGSRLNALSISSAAGSRPG
jgi:hypothetical protein